MNEDFIVTLYVTIRLALITTCILFIVGLPVSYMLAYKRIKGKALIEVLIHMPLVLPPTVVGYYLLVLFSPQNYIGYFFETYLGTRLSFDFNGILLASIISNLPFMIRPLQNAFASLPTNIREASYIMGKSELETFIYVLMPNIIPSIAAALTMTIAHTIGEFGIVLMIGGNIPGETRVASIAIYDEVQALNSEIANRYSLILFLFSFILLLIIIKTTKQNKYDNREY